MKLWFAKAMIENLQDYTSCKISCNLLLIFPGHYLLVETHLRD